MRNQSKRHCLLSVFFFLTLMIGCRNGWSDSAIGVHGLPSIDSCLFEPDHHYYIALPEPRDPEHSFPLVIAIDPHGDGLLAVQKFRDALSGLPIIVAGSDKLRNNYEGFERSLVNLNNDLLTKYPVEPTRVIVAGFSGGARMALYYGLGNQVEGIIMFGAGPGQHQSGFLEKQFYAISGTRDFNFSEQYRPLFRDMEGSHAYMYDYFRGTHEWPPAKYIREAVVYCLRDEPGPFKLLSNKLSEGFLKEADSLQNAGDLLFAGKALEKAYFFTSEREQQDILTGRIKDFKKNPDWIASQKKIENLLRSEAAMKRLYAENLQDPDMEWWSGELDKLLAQLNTAEDPMERDYYARLKGFLGIYLYSRINTLLQQGNAGDLLDRLMKLYERVEPESEDLVKFKALLAQLR